MTPPMRTTMAEGGGDGAGEEEEEEVAAERAIAREQDDDELVLELLDVIESVRSFGDYRRTQKKECFNLVRWMKLVVPFLEELQEIAAPIPDAAYIRLSALAKAFAATKKLLRCCHDGSKIYLALESEAVIGRFRMVYDKLNQALDGMPYDELGVSDEVKEQVPYSPNKS